MKNHYALYGRSWYLKNKEKNLERGRVWNSQNREKRVKITQNYVKRNKEKVSNYNKLFDKTYKGRLRTYLNSAKKRNCDFTLSSEDFFHILSKPCSYCGSDTKIGVDRINNLLGYTKENSTSCCATCNYMKKNLSFNEFINHVKKISNYNS